MQTVGGGVKVIGLVILTVLLVIIDFFLLGKYLNLNKEKKFYVLFAVKTIVNILNCTLLLWKCPNTAYSYFMLCFVSILSVISIEDACSMKIDRLLSWSLLAIGSGTDLYFQQPSQDH